MRIRRLLACVLVLALLAPVLSAEDDDRLPGWLGEVARSGVGAKKGKSKRQGKSRARRRAADEALGPRFNVTRLPADGIPVPGTVHPDVRALQAPFPLSGTPTSSSRLARSPRR